MKLDDFLHMKRLTRQKFADETGFCRCYIGLICTGKVRPSKRSAKLISDATGGLCSIEDLLTGKTVTEDEKLKMLEDL